MSSVWYFFVVFLLFNAISANDFELSGSIIGIDVSPSLARISLDAGDQIAIPHKNGKFYFHDLSIGEHSLEIHLSGYEWHTYMIDVRSNGKIRKFKSQKKEAESPKFVIAPVKKAQYVLVCFAFFFLFNCYLYLIFAVFQFDSHQNRGTH